MEEENTQTAPMTPEELADMDKASEQFRNSLQGRLMEFSDDDLLAELLRRQRENKPF